MKMNTFAALTLAGVLVASSTATAKLPDFADNRITSKAMGGAKLGMTYAQVVGKWGIGGVDEAVGERCGGPGSDPQEWTCTWKKTSTLKAWVRFENRKAAEVGISGPRKSRPGRLRTPQGYCLGTSLEKLFTGGCQSSPGGPYLCNGVALHSNGRGRVGKVTIGRP